MASPSRSIEFAKPGGGSLAPFVLNGEEGKIFEKIHSLQTLPLKEKESVFDSLCSSPRLHSFIPTFVRKGLLEEIGSMHLTLSLKKLFASAHSEQQLHSCLHCENAKILNEYLKNRNPQQCLELLRAAFSFPQAGALTLLLQFGILHAIEKDQNHHGQVLWHLFKEIAPLPIHLFPALLPYGILKVIN